MTLANLIEEIRSRLNKDPEMRKICVPLKGTLFEKNSEFEPEQEKGKCTITLCFEKPEHENKEEQMDMKIENAKNLDDFIFSLEKKIEDLGKFESEIGDILGIAKPFYDAKEFNQRIYVTDETLADYFEHWESDLIIRLKNCYKELEKKYMGTKDEN